VVSYDIDGAREVVLDGRTGFLIPPREIDKLAAALTALASDPAMRERFSAEGRRRFTDQFRHERMTEQIRDLYVKILGIGDSGLDKSRAGTSVPSGR
jgi:glycosyltransferase involved in cell wall biosynthesis